MIRSKHRFLSFGALFLAASLHPSSVLAQDGAGVQLDLITSSTKDTTIGEFTGDGVADVAMLSSGSLVIYHDPAIYDYPVVPSTSLPAQTALAVLPKLSTSSTDRLISSDALGLTVWSLDSELFEILPSPLPGTGLAANARELHAEDMNDDGLCDLVVIGPVGQSVSVWYQDATGSLSLAMNATVNEELIGLFAGDWDPDRLGSEWLAVYPSHLGAVLPLSLTEFESHPLIGTAHEAVAVREQYNLGTAIAILEDRPGGTRWLSMWRPEGQSAAGVGLGSMGFFGLSAGDADGDGSDDVALAATTTPTVVTFINLINSPGGPDLSSFNATATFARLYAPYSTTGPTFGEQPSATAIADLDGDGDADSVFACDASGELSLALNGLLISETSLRPRIDSVDIVPDPQGELNAFEVTGHLDMDFPFASADVDLELRRPDDFVATTRVTITGLQPGDSFHVTLYQDNPGTVSYQNNPFVVALTVQLAGDQVLSAGPAQVFGPILETMPPFSPVGFSGGPVLNPVLPVVARPSNGSRTTPPQVSHSSTATSSI